MHIIVWVYISGVSVLFLMSSNPITTVNAQQCANGGTPSGGMCSCLTVNFTQSGVSYWYGATCSGSKFVVRSSCFVFFCVVCVVCVVCLVLFVCVCKFACVCVCIDHLVSFNTVFATDCSGNPTFNIDVNNTLPIYGCKMYVCYARARTHSREYIPNSNVDNNTEILCLCVRDICVPVRHGYHCLV